MTDYILQRLYDSEINFKMSTFWDGGFDWWLGDDMNGYKAEGTARSYQDAVDEIVLAARRHFPTSTFAMFRTQEEQEQG